MPEAFLYYFLDLIAICAHSSGLDMIERPAFLESGLCHVGFLNLLGGDVARHI
jgi:hypothetical protein